MKRNSIPKEIEKINNIEEYVNNLTEDELTSKLQSYSNFCIKQLAELQTFILGASQWDGEEIIKVSPIHNELAESQELHKKGDENSLDEDEINPSLMRIKYSNKMAEMENEYKLKLEKMKERLKNEFEEQMNKINEEHELKVTSLQKEIEDIQAELEEYQEESKYIKKSEHETMLQKILNENSKEIEEYQKQIEESEKLIKDKYPHLINYNTSNMKNMVPKFEKNSLNEKSFEESINNCINQLKVQNGNSDNIILISSLVENPIQTIKELSTITDLDLKDSESDCVDTEADIIVNSIPHSNYKILSGKNKSKENKNK